MKKALYGLILLVAIFLPLFVGTYYLHLLVLTGIYCILVLGLNIIMGYTGQASLAQASFYGIGAYTSAILTLLIIGFFYGGTHAGTEMLVWWILANGVLAGFGAVMALAHPFTILSSILAAPLTSLNPMIAAGWVSGLVEAFSRKPKVRDFENLQEDIHTLKGFWKNNITRILLVVVFTNIGSSLGTFVAIPLMVKVL